MTQNMDPKETSGQIKRAPTIRARAIFWAILLCFPVCYWNAWQPTGTIYSLIFSTMAALIVLVAVNALLHKFAPKHAFTTADMVIIFGFVSVASAISGEWTFLNMQYVHVFASNAQREPLYRDVFLEHIPPTMYFTDINQIRDYVAGGNGFWYFLSRLDLWLPKILMWTLLYGAITISLLCVNSLMRDAWLRRERLSFPIVQLPVAMMEEDGKGPLWRSKTMWIAFILMFAIDILNGLHYLFPNLPSIPTKQYLDLRNIFPDPPINAIGSTPIALYPFLAALGLFMPSGLLFSIIFFFFVRKTIQIILATYGFEGGTFAGGHLVPEPPYFTEQTWGALIGLFVTAMWIARKYLHEVWKDIRENNPAKDGGISHRTAFVVFIICITIVASFLGYGDMPLFLIAPYLLAFVGFSMVITRIRAQVGPPTREFAFLGPNQLLMNFYGTQNITQKNATILGTLFLGINRLSRSHPMPVQLEAMKMADNAKVNQRWMFGLLAAGLLVGLFIGAFWFVQKGYVKGSVNDWGDPLSIVRGVQEKSQGPSVAGMSMVFVGFSVVAVLDAIRFKIPGFWLHPVGYALSMNFGVDYYWFGLLIALIIKTLVQRYAGLKGYRQLRNVAFGVLIAEYTAEMIWATLAMLLRQSTYTIGFNERGVGTQ